MPMYELALPVSTTNPKITHNGVDYNLVESVFTAPAAASTNLRVSSSAAGDNTQNLVVYGIVAGVEVSESFALNGTTLVAGALDFTEVFEAYLDAVCAGTVLIEDSLGNNLGTILAGRRVLSPDTFKRVGKDGNEVILPLCGGDEFVGEILEGQHKKDWDADIVTFTARINGVVTGMLEMGGESAAPGTLRYGWLNNHHPFIMMNAAELEVELEIPTSDTGVAATEDIFFEFYIRNQKELITPTDDPDFIMVRFFIDENGLLMELYKEVGGVNTLLWDGSTADGNDGADPAGDKFWIFRFLFHDGVAGATAPENVRHMHVYAKHAATRVGLDTATEEELIDTVGATQSPYNISDLLFTVGYPAYQIISAHDTWFGSAVGSGNEAISTYLRTSYPTLFALKYDFTDAEYGDGDMELWDMKGATIAAEADWQQIFDEDHDFAGNNIVLQNGLIRLWINQADANPRLRMYHWFGGAWVFRSNVHGYSYGGLTSIYAFVTGIKSISPEKITLEVRLHDTAVEDNNHYVDLEVTIRRGNFIFEFNPTEIFPLSNANFYVYMTPYNRHGFVGDDYVGDDDIGKIAVSATLTDNMCIYFDDAGAAYIWMFFSNKKPDGAPKLYRAYFGRNIEYQDLAAADVEDTIFYIGLIPFPLVAGLFKEAEDVSLTGAAVKYFTDPAGASNYLRARSAAGGDVGQVLTIIGSVAGVRTEDTITLDGVNWVNGSVDFDRVYILKLSAVTAGNITVEDEGGVNVIHVIPAGTTHVDNAAVLTVQLDDARWWSTAGTNLPAGRYILFARMYDTAHTVDDVNLYMWGATSGYRNEENDNIVLTLGASYLYYGVVVDIPEGVVADLEALRATVHKNTAAANPIYVDYFLLVPIGDGEDWPQDLAHAALRTFTKPRRLYVR